MRQRGFKFQVCGAICPSRREHQRHLQKFNHWPSDCRRCARTFPSAEGLHDHEVSFHNYCRECNRSFPTLQSIKTIGPSSRETSQLPFLRPTLYIRRSSCWSPRARPLPSSARIEPRSDLPICPRQRSIRSHHQETDRVERLMLERTRVPVQSLPE
ncbi:unnamed protein product [Clonostachys rhizophaga]|uniref:C2H2-type domain-containing protein n=1 Tax=Clonostachys rhizophaga TaxID=160324 RepID=A0A9N9VIA2_9HYPO|nr:unnamed protein product [Clonostachys rhizophaga]